MKKGEEQRLITAFIDYLAECATANKRQLFERVLQQRTGYLSVALDQMKSVHDASAVMRSCDIFGVQKVTVWSDEQAFRATRGVALGSAKWLSVTHLSTADETGKRAWYLAEKEAGRRMVGLSTSKSAMPISDLSLDQPLCLVLGPENRGLDPVSAEYIDDWVWVPSMGASRYYNLSVCAALCLDELSDRLRGSELAWPLAEADQKGLLLTWYSQLFKRRQLMFEHFLAQSNLLQGDLEPNRWPEPFRQLMNWNL